ncbi:MAG: hypothetical protein IT453_16170 [Planctomycetes bacterium]|nr:hypothetical protein [Planctomycetota bacterium]
MRPRSVPADISRNVGEAASSSGTIAQSVAEVAQDARKTGSGVEGIGASAVQLGELSAGLEALVASFRLEHERSRAPLAAV